MPCDIFDELLGYRIPIVDIPCFHRYVLFRELIATLSANVTDTVTGILWSYHGAGQGPESLGIYIKAYISICVSLNVLITLMIIMRLALHSRNIRNAIGASPGLGGLYTAVITMLVESSALNAVGYLLYIVSNSPHKFFFTPPLGEIQVGAASLSLQYTAVPRHRLIIEADRSFLCSSSLYESQTRLH